MKKLLAILTLSIVVLGCSSDDNQNSNDDNTLLELSPPNWIIGTWIDTRNYNEGLRFIQNDIFILNGTNDEISFIDTGNEVLSEGHGYILREELKTSTEYWLYTETIDESTGQTLPGTYPKTWKWETRCDDAISDALSSNSSRVLRNENSGLIPPLVDLNINLNLPEYEALNYSGNSITINSQGIKGISIYNINNNLFVAFELTDPNHSPNDCSEMTIEGIIATCPCPTDNNSYDIVTGQYVNQNDYCKFPMIQYHAERTGDNIHIWN